MGLELENFKELFDTIGSRLKSRILGSIIIALILTNWKSLFFLFFDSAPTLEKFTFVETQFSVFWSLILPIIIGFFVGILSPWLTYWGALLAEEPSTRRRLIQLKSDQAVLERKQTLEAKLAELSDDQEQRLIERAKRYQDIETQIDDPELVNRLRSELDELRSQMSHTSGSISAEANEISLNQRIQNLQSLAENYRQMGEHEKAAMLLEEARESMSRQ